MLTPVENIDLYLRFLIEAMDFFWSLVKKKILFKKYHSLAYFTNSDLSQANHINYFQQ